MASLRSATAERPCRLQRSSFQTARTSTSRLRSIANALSALARRLPPDSPSSRKTKATSQPWRLASSRRSFSCRSREVDSSLETESRRYRTTRLALVVVTWATYHRPPAVRARDADPIGALTDRGPGHRDAGGPAALTPAGGGPALHAVGPLCTCCDTSSAHEGTCDAGSPGAPVQGPPPPRDQRRRPGQLRPHPADHAPVLLAQRVSPALVLEHHVAGFLARSAHVLQQEQCAHTACNACSARRRERSAGGRALAVGGVGRRLLRSRRGAGEADHPHRGPAGGEAPEQPGEDLLGAELTAQPQQEHRDGQDQPGDHDVGAQRADHASISSRRSQSSDAQRCAVARTPSTRATGTETWLSTAAGSAVDSVSWTTTASSRGSPSSHGTRSSGLRVESRTAHTAEGDQTASMCSSHGPPEVRSGASTAMTVTAPRVVLTRCRWAAVSSEVIRLPSGARPASAPDAAHCTSSGSSRSDSASDRAAARASAPGPTTISTAPDSVGSRGVMGRRSPRVRVSAA